MKTLALTLALVIVSSFGFAQFPQTSSPDSCCFVSEDLRVAIFMDDDSFINVKMAKVAGELVKIVVKQDNKVLHQKRVKRWEVADLKYNIKDFPKGDYVFEIVKNNEVVYSRSAEELTSNEQFAQNK
jgi:ribosomal protein S6